MTWSHVLSMVGYSFGVTLFLSIQCVAILMEPFELPGLWVQFAAAVVFNMLTGLFSWPGCFLILLIASAGQGLGWLFSKLGFTSVKASRVAAWSAVLCGFAGAFFGFVLPIPIPLVGSMIMSFIGTFVGAILGEMLAQRKVKAHLPVALGAVLGRACSISARVALAFTSACLAVMVLSFELFMAARG